MKILILNGSPRRKGTIAALLEHVADGVENPVLTEWIDVYDLSMKPCIGCMKCRQTGRCILAEDDAHRVGQKIREADGLIIGTPTYWGNMSAQLKMLFERNVPVFMGESKKGIPTPRQKGKKAVIVTACTTPFPFNFILPQSRGAVRAVKEVLRTGGYRIKGVVVKPGTKKHKGISGSEARKAKRSGLKLTGQAS